MNLFLTRVIFFDAGDLKLTREIIVIAGEKGKCHQALSNQRARGWYERLGLPKDKSVDLR